MDHTIIAYLIDDKNQYLDHINPYQSEQQMATKIVESILLNENIQMKRKERV